jgi:hypothetical protein
MGVSEIADGTDKNVGISVLSHDKFQVMTRGAIKLIGEYLYFIFSGLFLLSWLPKSMTSHFPTGGV